MNMCELWHTEISDYCTCGNERIWHTNLKFVCLSQDVVFAVARNGGVELHVF